MGAPFLNGVRVVGKGFVVGKVLGFFSRLAGA